jgi:hypothetical protein
MHDAGSTHPVLSELRGDSVTDEAFRIVSSSRRKDYGHPLDNWDAIAEGFTGVLKARGILKPGSECDAETAVLCMQIVKVMREAYRPKRDNRVDGPGYWLVLDQIVEERARRENPT